MNIRYYCALLAVPLCLLPIGAMAQTAGRWHVTGDIDGKAFAVDCDFEARGNGLGGQCVDRSTGDTNAKPGKVHRLTKGSIQGREVKWTYQTKVMMMSVDIDFAGTVQEEHMAGTITAKGRRGRFSAVRKPA